MRNGIRNSVMLLATLASLSACNPTVKVEAPDKPITINMNIKIEHEIRVKVEKDLENVLSEDSGLF
ncbi:MAG: YnbE family lipoprotein [Zetaproteobacteria bacterium CG1_02_53_45]|nr:MAG: YnbE family lipoprotein [Zetaproteobacteria bacterium CG1_02_53_45]